VSRIEFFLVKAVSPAFLPASQPALCMMTQNTKTQKHFFLFAHFCVFAFCYDIQFAQNGGFQVQFCYVDPHRYYVLQRDCSNSTSLRCRPFYDFPLLVIL